MKLKHCHNQQFLPNLGGELSFSTSKAKVMGEMQPLREDAFLKTPRNSGREYPCRESVVGKNIEITLNIKYFPETYDSKI